MIEAIIVWAILLGAVLGWVGIRARQSKSWVATLTVAGGYVAAMVALAWASDWSIVEWIVPFVVAFLAVYLLLNPKPKRRRVEERQD